MGDDRGEATGVPTLKKKKGNKRHTAATGIGGTRRAQAFRDGDWNCRPAKGALQGGTGGGVPMGGPKKDYAIEGGKEEPSFNNSRRPAWPAQIEGKQGKNRGVYRSKSGNGTVTHVL